MSNGRRWTEDSDLVVFYLYRYRTDQLPITLPEIARRLQRPEHLLRMRQGHFRFLDTGGQQGLSHYIRQQELIYIRYRNTTEEELRPMVLRALGLQG